MRIHIKIINNTAFFLKKIFYKVLISDFSRKIAFSGNNFIDQILYLNLCIYSFQFYYYEIYHKKTQPNVIMKNKED